MSKKSQAQLAPLDPLRRYDVDTAAEYLGISRPWLFKKIKRGEVPVIRDGRRTFVAGATIASLSSVPQ